jgi:hypothetical protein
MVVRCTIAAAAFALFVAPVAGAAPWKQVTASGGSNIDQVGLLRTVDGTLHVTWHRRTGPNTEDLLHTPISAAGTVGMAAPIQTNWTEIQNAALVAAPGGVRVFCGGIRTTEPGEPNQELNFVVHRRRCHLDAAAGLRGRVRPAGLRQPGECDGAA